MDNIKVGDVINNYRILDLDAGREHRKVILKCVCNSCNENIIYRTLYELNKHAPRCKICYKKQLDSYIGKKYGRLTVLEYVGKNESRFNIFKCKCDCGEIKNFTINSLLSGNTSSCGCYYQDTIVTHHMTNTRIYRIYTNIIKRCYDNNHISYNSYGGRGIRVCSEWLEDFMNFYNDMGASYEEHVKMHGEQNTSIDRIDVDKNYCKENCKWATWEEQANNRRNSISINLYGRNFTLKDISNMYNIPYDILRHHYHNNTLYWILENYYESNYVNKNSSGKVTVVKFVT